MSSVVIAGDTSGSVTLNAQAVSGTTVLTLPTTSGTVALTGNNQIQTQLFTAPGTWTNPGTVTQVRVTVIGGGGGGHGGNISGGLGGLAIAMVPVSAPVAITVGAGGAASTPAGTSSFGPAVSATGGAGGATPAPINVPGSGTVSVGTSLKTFVTSASVGIIFGELTNGTPTGPAVPATPYSTTSLLTAGARGIGAPLTPASSGGVGGAVVVEWIG